MTAASTAYQAAADRHKKLTFKYELKREQKIIDSDSAFYRFVSSRLSNKHDKDGHIITDDAERANLLNNYFASICVDDDGSIERVMPDEVSI